MERSGVQGEGGRAGACAWKDRLYTVALASLYQQAGSSRRGAISSELKGLRKSGAMEEQTAVTAALPERVKLSVLTVAGLGLTMFAGHLHRHASMLGHRLAPAVVHGHGLSDQRADKHHQHCKEADPGTGAATRANGHRSPCRGRPLPSGGLASTGTCISRSPAFSKCSTSGKLAPLTSRLRSARPSSIT